jgi:hypothetical protein
LYNLSQSNHTGSYAHVSPDQLVKKRSYSNTVRGRTTYPIPDDIQKIINNSNLPSIFIDGKFQQNFYVKWGGDCWVHTFRNVCLYQSKF